MNERLTAAQAAIREAALEDVRTGPQHRAIQGYDIAEVRDPQHDDELNPDVMQFITPHTAVILCHQFFGEWGDHGEAFREVLHANGIGIR